ncbi:TonB-dependent receptor plug domain-containing protein [Candidatus Margulisiibacteriota bacterium]
MKKVLLFFVLAILLFQFILYAAPDAIELASTGPFTQSLPVELVVTASRYISVQPNSTIITQSDLIKYNDSTIGSVLESIPGITIKRNGGKGAQTSIFIQGAASDQALALLNGSPISNPIYGNVDLAGINPENIETIEVYRGGMSSVFGSDAIGGVINIITKKPDNKTVLKAGYGSFNDRTISLEHSLCRSFFDYRLNYSAGKYDGFREISYFDNNNLSTELNLYPADDLNLNLYISTYFSRQGNPGPDTAWATPFEQEKQGYTIQETIYAAGDNDEKVKIYFSQTGDNSQSFNGSSYRYQSWSSSYGYQHSINTGIHSFVFGGELYTARPEDNTLTRNESVDNKAYFINDEIKLTGTLKTNIGLRSDQHSNFGRADTYKISTAWEFVPDSRLKASYGTSFHAPAISDLYYYDYNAAWGSTMQGNPALKPENAHNLDIELSSVISNINTRLSFFQKYIRNMIQWYSPDWINWTVENIGRARLAGFELELNSSLSKDLNYNLNITYLTDAIDETTNGWLFYRPRYKAVLTADYQSPYGTFSKKVHYVAERSSLTGGASDLKAYWTLDITYKWQYLSLYIRNLFDYQYEETKDYPMPGRTIGVEIRHEL